MTLTQVLFFVCFLSAFAIVAAVAVADNNGWKIPYDTIEFWLMVIIFTTVAAPFLLLAIVCNYIKIEQMAQAIGRMPAATEDTIPEHLLQKVGLRNNVYNWNE